MCNGPMLMETPSAERTESSTICGTSLETSTCVDEERKGWLAMTLPFMSWISKTAPLMLLLVGAMIVTWSVAGSGK